MRCQTRLAAERLDPNAEFAEFQSGVVDEGAIVVFVGIARPQSTCGREVRGVFLDYHPRMTEASLREIAEESANKFNISAISVVHRCGDVAPKEAIVFVATAALHRRAAFEAAEYAMDRLKTEAIFWKREDAVDGSRWIEPTITDRVDRARWSS